MINTSTFSIQYSVFNIRFLAIALIVVAPGIAHAQTDPGAERVRALVRSFHQARAPEIVEELRQFLSIPNVASDRVNILSNANHLVRLLRQRGAEARLLEVEGSPPAVFGELITPTARRTVVFYAHYDGQPVDTTRWHSHPWRPVLRSGSLAEGGRELAWDTIRTRIDPEWRIYARSASDDKSPIIAMLTAIDALRAADIPLSVNLKFFFEGEEEAGSDHLHEFLTEYGYILQADAWIFCDGPVHQTRLAQVVYGVRGVMDMQLTTYGANRALHSGHYGNWSPNPAVMLLHLLAGMRDQDGKILVDGFYDDVPSVSDVVSEAIQNMPDVESMLKDDLALGRVEGGDRRLLEQIMQPALNVQGIAAGNVGAAARNAIPTTATANIDFRMVPNQRPMRVRELVERHITRQGFHIVHEEPDETTLRAHPRVARLDWGGGYPAMQTPMDMPVSRAVADIVEQAEDTTIVRVPLLGGSLPLFTFREVLNTPLIIVPMVNHDNNQHAPNENLRMQNLWEGIERYAALFARLGPALRQ